MSLERKEYIPQFVLACPQTWTDYFLTINICSHQRPVREFFFFFKSASKRLGPQLTFYFCQWVLRQEFWTRLIFLLFIGLWIEYEVPCVFLGPSQLGSSMCGCCEKGPDLLTNLKISQYSMIIPDSYLAWSAIVSIHSSIFTPRSSNNKIFSLESHGVITTLYEDIKHFLTSYFGNVS